MAGTRWKGHRSQAGGVTQVPTAQHPPVGSVSHNPVPHSIGTQEEADEENAAGGPLDTREAAAWWPVPDGQPNVLVKEAALQLSHQQAPGLPQGCLTWGQGGAGFSGAGGSGLPLQPQGQGRALTCRRHLLLHEAAVGLSLH